MTSDDMTEPRYSFAKAKANEVWKHLGGEKIPIQINDIVKTLGIPVSEQELTISGSANLHADGIFYISLKKDMSIERKRFTVAHEIGHIVLDHLTFTGQSSQYSSGSQENEADYFAGSLLVPTNDLRNFMKNKDKTIEDIMSRYWVSKSVAGIAIKSNRLLNQLHVE